MVHRSSSRMSDRTSDVAAWHFQIESPCSLHWPESVLFETVEQSECESSISKCSFEHVYLIAETHSVGKKNKKENGSLSKEERFFWLAAALVRLLTSDHFRQDHLSDGQMDKKKRKREVPSPHYSISMVGVSEMQRRFVRSRHRVCIEWAGRYWVNQDGKGNVQRITHGSRSGVKYHDHKQQQDFQKVPALERGWCNRHPHSAPRPFPTSDSITLIQHQLPNGFISTNRTIWLGLLFYIYYTAFPLLFWCEVEKLANWKRKQNRMAH